MYDINSILYIKGLTCCQADVACAASQLFS
jgi:hypothetical protein